MPAIAYAALWNVTGNPAASVPCGIAEDGLPIAVQLVGRTDDEPTLISLAAQIEAARPWPLFAGRTLLLQYPRALAGRRLRDRVVGARSSPTSSSLELWPRARRGPLRISARRVAATDN